MPQTESIMPELFAYRLQDFARGLDIPKVKNAAEALSWYEKAQKAERDEWVKLITQRDRERDRDILTKAAERAVAWLSAGFIDEWLAPDAKESLRKAILAPLDKTDKGE